MDCKNPVGSATAGRHRFRTVPLRKGEYQIALMPCRPSRRAGQSCSLFRGIRVGNRFPRSIGLEFSRPAISPGSIVRDRDGEPNDLRTAACAIPWPRLPHPGDCCSLRIRLFQWRGRRAAKTVCASSGLDKQITLRKRSRSNCVVAWWNSRVVTNLSSTISGNSNRWAVNGAPSVIPRKTPTVRTIGLSRVGSANWRGLGRDAVPDVSYRLWNEFQLFIASRLC